MITRPLDLASKLRAAPASFDWLFYVNGGLIVLFFFLFGSQFVLAPSLGVEFRPPEMVGANAHARLTTHQVTVTDSGQIFVGQGSVTLEQFQSWLREQMADWKLARRTDPPVLLVQQAPKVPTDVWMRIVGVAQDAGFSVAVWAAEQKTAPVDPRRPGPAKK